MRLSRSSTVRLPLQTSSLALELKDSVTDTSTRQPADVQAAVYAPAIEWEVDAAAATNKKLFVERRCLARLRARGRHLTCERS